jgi:hypothetical protein
MAKEPSETHVKKFIAARLGVNWERLQFNSRGSNVGGTLFAKFDIFRKVMTDKVSRNRERLPHFGIQTQSKTTHRKTFVVISIMNH